MQEQGKGREIVFSTPLCRRLKGRVTDAVLPAQGLAVPFRRKSLDCMRKEWAELVGQQVTGS